MIVLKSNFNSDAIWRIISWMGFDETNYLHSTISFSCAAFQIRRCAFERPERLSKNADPPMSHTMTDREYKRYTGLNLVDLKVILTIPFAGDEHKKAY